jgi:hypothetical protein
MAFDINQFIAQGLIYGGARTSKFDVQLTLPTNLSGIDNNAVKKLNFTCKAAAIPSFRVGTVQIPYFGRKIKSAGDRVWDDWRITIMLDEDYTTRALFESWSNSINKLESNVMQTNFDGELYKALWTVTHYSKDGTPIRVYNIVNGWPANVGAMVLDWDGTDRISQFDVDVAFDNFIPASGGETPWVNSTTTTYAGSI